MLVILQAFPKQNADSLKSLLLKNNLSIDKKIEFYLDLSNTIQPENLDSSYKCLIRAKKLAEKSKNLELVGNVYHDLGIYYYILGKSDEALEELLNGLKFYQKANAFESIAICYISISEVLRSQAEYDEALKYLKLAYNLAVKQNLFKTIKSFYKQYSAILFEMRKLPETLKYIDSAINFHFELNNDEFLISVYNIKGSVWRDLRNNDSALFYLNKSAEYAQKEGNYQALALIYNNIAYLFFNQKNYYTASKSAHKSLVISIKDSILTYMEQSYLILSKIYKETGRYDSAYQYFIYYTDVRWKIFNLRKSTESAFLQTKYELDKKKQENEKLKLTNEIQKQKIRFQSAVILISIILLAILSAIPIYINKKRKQLVIHNEELRIRTREIEEASKKLKLLIETKDKLFSIIAHDIKNPLQSIIGFSNLLESELAGKLADNQKEYLDYIRDGGENLNFLLENLLRWSMLQTDNLSFPFEKVDLSQIISKIIKLFESSLKRKNITIESSLPENLYAFFNSPSVSTIFRNLISNAIKFSFIGGKIYITHEQNDKFVKISIRDEGMGMNHETCQKLFTSDIKPQHGTTGEHGSGLGLILVKEFIEKNNGKIDVKSDLSVGTTFSIELPVANN